MRVRRSALVVLLLLVSAACGHGSAPVHPRANAPSTWPTYHANTARTGDGGSSLSVLTGALRVAWSDRLDGAVYGEPIQVGTTAIVATEADSVYALNLASGKVVWHHKLGTPVPLSNLPCGNINPLGITGTPAYDVTTGSIFVVTETTNAVHTLWALYASTGAVKWHRSLDVETRRDRTAQQQRGAAIVVGSRVIVAFGGLYGDCGNYVGYVTSVPTSGSGSTTVFTVPTAREGGIWAAPGPVRGPTGLVYVSVGNGAATSGTWDGTDSVLALDPTTMRRVYAFAPVGWQNDNAQDLDLGSMSPVVVGSRIVAAGKRGTVYLLSDSLGKAITSRTGCTAFGGAAVRGATVFLPCDSGVRALKVGTSSTAWSWQASGIPGSPVVAGGAVYVLDPGAHTFYELSVITGRIVGHLVLNAGITRFATPTVFNGGHGVLVPTTTGVMAIT